MKKIIVCLGFVLFVSACSSNNKKNFTSIYERYCKEPWSEIGKDGSYISIDSNPYDVDDEETGSTVYFTDAWEAVKNINMEIGFPEAVNKKMGNTTLLDGKQSETINGIVLTWKYHPDKGMEVMYTFESK